MVEGRPRVRVTAPRGVTGERLRLNLSYPVGVIPPHPQLNSPRIHRTFPSGRCSFSTSAASRSCLATPARARQLLGKGRARVHKLYPFTIRLTDRLAETSEIDGMAVKIDPGSKATGIAVTRTDENGDLHGLVAVEVRHRGGQISKKLTARGAYRRRRRSANLRYRAPRFNNRTKPKGWLAPSLQHRVDNVIAWVTRLRKLAPVTSIAMETVRFDTQLLQNPEVSGVEYQQGTLAEYELREYLLEKYHRACVYCDATGVPLNLDHLVPRAHGGSDRAANRVLACVACNQAKGASAVEQFVTDPNRLAKILADVKKPLRDAAGVNSTRNALLRGLEATGMPVEAGTGGRTKWNRHHFSVPKSHTLDGLCVGEVSGIAKVSRDVLIASSTGRGTYQRTLPDKFGFPRLHRSRIRQHHGFQTGDLVRATVPSGKKAGTHTGRVAVRATGSFNITTGEGTVQGVHHRHCRLLQRADGFSYQTGKETALLPALTDGVSAREER
ncbi:RNA-guided endonuclease IscB [Mycolicibacterium conceptionense]|uniref:RNA-guided endonuclease IscB n=1 Tax=Mycolicibacterium conceptionense TaxID=451644 RepID=UPI001969C11F|nr:RNA-guided endonuclease IscB [Mycolicibacterium conceptionense]